MALNDYRTNTYPGIIDVPREETASLLAKVLAITSLGFLVTALGVATAPAWGTLPGFIVVLALIFAINFTRKANPALALGLFLTLTYFMGWEIGPLIQRYIHNFGPGIVFNAAATTGAGMAVMGCVAYLFNINYRRIAGIAFAVLLCLIIAGIASMFFHFLSPGHLLLAHPRHLRPPHRRRLRPHPRRRRRPLRSLALPLHLSRRHQHLPRRPPTHGRPPQRLIPHRIAYFPLGGYCLNILLTAWSIFLLFLSGLSDSVPFAAPRQSSCFVFPSLISTTNVPTLVTY